MKHVVSVSLGSSKRDIDQVVSLLGQELHIERRGTDGDMAAAGRLIQELDGEVDAIGLGGIDLYVFVADRRYTFRDAAKLAAQAKVTPVVCGAGLKNTLERRTVEQLEPELHWSDKKVLMASAVDRFGMAEQLIHSGAKVLFGDVIFALGLPVPLYSLAALRNLATVLLPVITRLPFTWIYPTGDKQEIDTKNKFGRYYDWADVIAGDWHFIRRYAPTRLDGKIILTNTTTADNIELLREKGATKLITTTPRFDGRSLATNLLEASLVAISETYPLSAEAYRALLQEADMKPAVLELQE